MSFRVLIFFCLAAAAPAASSTSPLVQLAERAHSLPGEFAAEALLRIASAPGVSDRAWKRQLIEDAFHLAATAQQPFPRRAWTHSRTGFLDKAYAQGLDALTLQSHAVSAMLAVDRKHARELLEQMPPPKIPALTCQDALVYDVSAFYPILAEVAMRSFDAKEIAQEEPLHLIQHYVSELSSPVQVGPVAQMLSTLAMKPAQLELLVNSLAGSLHRISGDDRAFSSTLSGEDSAGPMVAALADSVSHRQVNPLPVLEAWRAYLVQNLSGDRCEDSLQPQSDAMSARLISSKGPVTPDDSGGTGAVHFFNENMRTGGLPAISNDEVQPAKTEGKADVEGACQSPQCKDLAQRLTHLVLGEDGLGLTVEQKSGGGWGNHLREFLSALTEWKGDDNPAEYFRAESRFYGDLYNLTPMGPERDIVLSAMLGFLQMNNYQHDYRMEWFYPVNALIIRVFADPMGMKGTMKELRNSPDPVISLYAQLEQLLPRPLNRTVGLL